MHRLLTSLATGYTLFFFSESVFWGRFDPATPLWDYAVCWLMYSLLAYLLLTVISRFRVRSVWALFLAGAVFGWTGEGIIVQTMYDDLPLQISFTGLAWHAMISVCGGWYLLRRSLAEGPSWPVALVSLGLGLFWGLWSVFWWIELGFRTPLADFVRYAGLSGALLVAALAAESWLQPRDFGSTAAEAWLLCALGVVWFLATKAFAVPAAPFVLPPLMGIVFLALRTNRRRETRPDLLHELKVAPAGPRYLLVLLAPLTAAGVYWLVGLGGRGLPTNVAVYWTATPAGFVLLGASLYKVLTAPRVGEAEPVGSAPSPSPAAMDVPPSSNSR